MKKLNEPLILVASDVEYEKLIAEIYLDDQFIALISQDAGADSLRIVFGDSLSPVKSFDLDWFRSAISKAEKKLLGK